MINEIIKEKHHQAIEILNEKNIDMWLTFVRESSNIPDPALDIILGTNCTWQSAFIINKDSDTTAIIGSLDEENIKTQNLFKNIITYLKSVKEPLVEYIEQKDPKKIAINFSKNSNLADGLTYGMYLILNDHLKETVYRERLISSEEIISALRGRKSDTEIRIMKEAIKETIKIFDSVTKFIKPGKSELDIANYVKSIMKEKGFEPAWDADSCPAVFTGPDTAGAHASPTDRKIQPGHLVNMDFGIKYKGYCSDLQRTWYVLREGETEAPETVKKGFEVIRDAITKVAKNLKPGVSGCEMDDIARNYVVNNGYEEYPHGLGHQVGKLVHDGGGGLLPRWERYGNTPFMKVEKSQIYTIEPRLTVNGYGVSTLEEEVLITDEGCEFISPRQMELILIK